MAKEADVTRHVGATVRRGIGQLTYSARSSCGLQAPSWKPGSNYGGTTAINWYSPTTWNVKKANVYFTKLYLTVFTELKTRGTPTVRYRCLSMSASKQLPEECTSRAAVGNPNAGAHSSSSRWVARPRPRHGRATFRPASRFRGRLGSDNAVPVHRHLLSDVRRRPLPKSNVRGEGLECIQCIQQGSVRKAPARPASSWLQSRSPWSPEPGPEPRTPRAHTKSTQPRWAPRPTIVSIPART